MAMVVGKELNIQPAASAEIVFLFWRAKFVPELDLQQAIDRVAFCLKRREP